MRAVWFFLCTLWSLTAPIVALSAPMADNQLLKDLSTVDYWNRAHNRTMPVLYSHLLQGGYFNMPSARMGHEGTLSFGYASVPPYLIWNGGCQLTDRLEISGSYRIFSGVDDPILSTYGFGSLSDKGANLKCALILPEDSDYRLPGLAIGFEDFLGTRNFKSRYVVLTQVLPKYDLELSIGYGTQRIHHWFGGIAWIPFRQSCYSYLEGLALVAEYDATPYKNPEVELHPRGRVKRSPINLGIKYRFADVLDFSASYVRGHALALAISAYYDFGNSLGFLPKIDDPLAYRAPINREPLGEQRDPQWFSFELLFALKEQGFTMLNADLIEIEEERLALRLQLVNERYRQQKEVLKRLTYLLAALIPDGIDTVIAVIDAEGLPVEEYRIPVSFLRRYGTDCLCMPEFAVMAKKSEVIPCYTSSALYRLPLPLWRVSLLPKTNFFFGSSRGKFKFAIGAAIRCDGFIADNIYYDFQASYTFFEDLHASKGVDRLNPSQIINVRSDLLRYSRRPGCAIDYAYLQKSTNLGNGWYARAAVGLFEIEYGGLAGEVLFYPVESSLAIGFETACLRKRTLKGIGFSDKVRKLHDFHEHYRGFLGSQLFLNGYFDWKEANLDLRVKFGKFLANDIGVRYEICRYFPSGMRIMFWYSRTNAHDRINGERYFDKGVSVTMPLDLFYTHSSRGKWTYGMSAWLRDVGVIAATGRSLYDTIYEQRQ